MAAPDEPVSDRPARKRSGAPLLLALTAGLGLAFLVAWVGIGAYAEKQRERQANINRLLQEHAEARDAIRSAQKMVQDYDQQLKALPAKRAHHKRAGGNPRAYDAVDQSLRTKIRETMETMFHNEQVLRDVEEELQKRYGVSKEEVRRLVAERE